jgi:hypothetical protein
MMVVRQCGTYCGSISEFVPSPNGKEIAIVSRGEILLPMPMVEVPKNTNTPEQERHVQWSTIKR